MTTENSGVNIKQNAFETRKHIIIRLIFQIVESKPIWLHIEKVERIKHGWLRLEHHPAGRIYAHYKSLLLLWLLLLILVFLIFQLCFAIAWYAHARLISPTLQATYQSVHVFNGLFLFTLSAATCFTGLNELGIYKA